MKVTNVSNGPRGFYVAGEIVFLEAGQTADDVNMVEGEVSSAESTGYFEISGKPAAKAPEVPAAGYAVTQKSPGWFVVTHDGAEVTKALRKDATEGFDAMSDEDKAAFVETNKVD